MEVEKMTPHELALKTYKDLQARKIARKKRAEYDCKSLKIDAAIKANNKIYKLRNR